MPFSEPRGGVPPERTPFPSPLSGSTPQLGPRATGARNPGGRWRRTCHGQGGPGTKPQVRVGHGGAEAGSRPGSWHSGPKPRTLEAGWLSGVALESRPSPAGNKALHVSLRMRPLLRIKTQFYFIFFRLKRGAEQLFPHPTFQKPTQQGSHFGRGGHGPTRAQWWGGAGLWEPPTPGHHPARPRPLHPTEPPHPPSCSGPRTSGRLFRSPHPQQALRALPRECTGRHRISPSPPRSKPHLPALSQKPWPPCSGPHSLHPGVAGVRGIPETWKPSLYPEPPVPLGSLRAEARLLSRPCPWAARVSHLERIRHDPAPGPLHLPRPLLGTPLPLIIHSSLTAPRGLSTDIPSDRGGGWVPD